MNLTTGYPYWLINSGLPQRYPKLDRNIKTQVAIIGGGISGAITAHFLTNAGIDCVVIDARTIGLGSTCASTSLLQYELDKPLCELSTQIGYSSASRAYQLCSESIDTLRDIAKKIAFPHFRNQDSVFFAAYKKDKKLIEDEFIVRKKAGFEVEFLDEKAIEQSYGFYATAAIRSRQGATTDAYLLTHALLQRNIKAGLSVFDRSRVSKINYGKKDVELVTEQGHTIHAKKIINATGYEVTEFIEKKIITLHSTFAIVSEHSTSNFSSWRDNTLLWNTADPYLYMRATEDRRIILGGRDEDFYNPAKRDRLMKAKTQALQKDFHRLFPDMPLVPEFSWAGTFGSTKDALPYIGTYDKTPHTYYALGFGGNGITFSVIAAQIITDIILGRENKDAALFSFSR